MATFLGPGPQSYFQDTLASAPKPDTIFGETGNDTIVSASSGGNAIYGSEDNDSLESRGPNDSVYGGTGNDVLLSRSFGTRLLGEGDRDTLTADVTATLYGGSGRDLLIAKGGQNILFGNEEEDSLLGGALGNDSIYGGQGNDLIGFLTSGGDNNIGVPVTQVVTQSNAGLNFVAGNLGNDTIKGVNSGDMLYGGQDNDSIIGYGSNTYVAGDLGNDIVTIVNLQETVQFQNVVATAGVTLTTLTGGGGDDSLYGAIGRFGEGFNFMDGGDGNDTIQSFAAQDSLLGGAGNDLITTATSDVLTSQGISSSTIGFAGQSTLNGGDGDDTLVAGFATDNLIGGAGNDSLSGFFTIMEGGEGNDTLDGSSWVISSGTTPFEVTLIGGAGDDFIQGASLSGTASGLVNLISPGEGNDTIVFTTTNDRLLSGSLESAGNDRISAGGLVYDSTLPNIMTDLLGNNTIEGSNGNDRITTGSGADFLRGGTITDGDAMSGAGDDTIFSGGGDDFLFGGSGSDVLTAQEGNDTLQGGIGRDILTGNEGNDVFLYVFKADVAASVSASLSDLITDFQAGEDKLYFTNSANDVGKGGFGFTAQPGVPQTQLGPLQFIEISDPNANYSNANAGISTPVLIYEQPSQAELAGGIGGILKYDPDGKGSASATTVAIFAPNDGNAVTIGRGDIVLF